MIKGKTNSGFEFEYDEQALNDMEFLDAVVESESGDASAILKAQSFMVIKLLGKDQRKRLYDHVRTADGRVPVEAIEQELTEMMAAGDPGKN